MLGVWIMSTLLQRGKKAKRDNNHVRCNICCMPGSVLANKFLQGADQLNCIAELGRRRPALSEQCFHSDLQYQQDNLLAALPPSWVTGNWTDLMLWMFKQSKQWWHRWHKGPCAAGISTGMWFHKQQLESLHLSDTRKRNGVGLGTHRSVFSWGLMFPQWFSFTCTIW